MKKSIVLIQLALLLVAGVILSGFPQETSAATTAQASEKKPIVLKTMWGQPPPAYPDSIVPPYLDRVNVLAQGELIMKPLGGQEVIPIGEQNEALFSGVIDFLFGTYQLYKKRVPEGRLLNLTKLSTLGNNQPQLERKTGVYDFLDEAHAKAGLKYLGRSGVYKPFYLFFNKPANSLKDLSGSLIAVLATSHAEMVKSWGMKPVIIPPPEIYTALERGTANGAFLLTEFMVAFSLHEVLKYQLLPAALTANTNTITMRLETWNELPKHLQDILNKASIYIEGLVAEIDIGHEQQYLQMLYDAGVKTIELEDQADRKRLVSAYWDVYWAEAKDNLSAEAYEKIKTLVKLEK